MSHLLKQIESLKENPVEVVGDSTVSEAIRLMEAVKRNLNYEHGAHSQADALARTVEAFFKFKTEELRAKR